jgi:hypothetical protein
MFTTYVACFRTSRDIDEIVFEKLLWKQLELIHTEDNPTDPNFGFSVSGLIDKVRMTANLSQGA